MSKCVKIFLKLGVVPFQYAASMKIFQSEKKKRPYNEVHMETKAAGKSNCDNIRKKYPNLVSSFHPTFEISRDIKRPIEIGKMPH